MIGSRQDISVVPDDTGQKRVTLTFDPRGAISLVPSLLSVGFLGTAMVE
jgi:hypothetical protein